MSTLFIRSTSGLSLLFLLLAALAPAARAQAGGATLAGRVTDAAGAPLPQVQVVATGEADGTRTATLTDAEGRYLLRGLRSGATYTVTLRGVGYASVRQTGVRPAAGGGEPLDFRLAQRPIHLSPIEVVSTAPVGAAGIPGSAHAISAELLEASRPLSAGEVIRRVPGVQVMDEDAFGLNLNIGVRGLNPRRSSRVLLLEDGAPIHLAPYGDPSAHYQPPIDEMYRVEVLKGSGQVLYGPQTVGGVINYVRPEPPSEAGGSLTASVGNQELRSGHLRLGGGRGRVAAALDLSRRQGQGPREHWGHRVDDLTGTARVHLGEEHSLRLRGSVFREDSDFGETGLTLAEFERDPFGNPSPNDVFYLRRYAGQAVYERRVGSDALFTANSYAQYVHRASWRQASESGDRFGSEEYARDFNCAPGALGLAECGNQGRPRTYRFAGVEPRLSLGHRLLGVESRADVGMRTHFELAERRQYLGEHAAARSGLLTRDNVLRTDAYSVFAQNRFLLGDWTVTPGLRLEHVRSENVNRMQETRLRDAYTQWLPGLGAAYNGIPGATVFAGAHRGFAPPRPADILNPRPGEGLVQVDPEVSWNYELGVRGSPFPGVRVEGTLFRIDFENQIVEGGLVGAGQRFVNAGETLHQGVELSGALELGTMLGSSRKPYLDVAYTRLARASFRSARLSTVDGETPVRGNRLPYAPEHLLNVGVGYASGGTDVRLQADHVSRQFTDDLNTVPSSADGQRGVIPARTVYSATVNQDIGTRGATLFLSARNLLDRVYITQRQEGIMVGMPRTVALGVRWDF